jgi:hypothetical protein
MEQEEESIRSMMDMFEVFNKEISNFNERKQRFERHEITDNCSKLLYDYGFFLARKQQAAADAAADAGAEAEMQRAIMKCLIPMIENKNLTADLILLLPASNSIDNFNNNILTLLNDNIKQRKFTLEYAENMFDLKIFKKNNFRFRLQNLAKDALKKKYPDIFKREKSILVLNFASSWNGNDINLVQLRQQQEQFLSKKGGNKNRKTIVKYRKKRHQYKKKTHKNKNKKSLKNRFVKK